MAIISGTPTPSSVTPVGGHLKKTVYMKKENVQKYIENGLINEQEHPTVPGLCIYNYTQKCQIDGAWDDITLNCRGFILNNKTGEILARPFPKFFNYGEREVDIPKEEPDIYEKYDGSLGILYWVDGEPAIATMGSFASDQAIWATKWFRKNVADVSAFDKEKTHLFEIIYRENRIVVSYDFEGLVYLGSRDTLMGSELFLADVPSPIRVAKKYDPTDFETLKSLSRDNAEGFVVLYPKSGFRLKLKFEEYKRLHRIVTHVTPRSIWEALSNGDDLSEVLDRVPDEFFEWVKGWQQKLETSFKEKEQEAQMVADKVKELPTRKDQALWLKDNASTQSSLVFSMLDGKDYKKTIWRELKPKAEDSFKTDEIFNLATTF
jgi:RNA ligase